MTCQKYLKDALELLLSWDLPEDQLADAVNDQARLIAGVPPEEIRQRHSDQSSALDLLTFLSSNLA